MSAVDICMHIMFFDIVTVIQDFFKRFGATDRLTGTVKARENNCGVCFLMHGDIEGNVWITFDCHCYFTLSCFLKLYVRI